MMVDYFADGPAGLTRAWRRLLCGALFAG